MTPAQSRATIFVGVSNVVSQDYASIPSRGRVGVVASETGRNAQQPLPYGRGSVLIALT